MRTRLLVFALAVMIATALGAELAGQQQGDRGGGAGRGGGRGRGLVPLLMESDAFPDGGIVPPKYAGGGAAAAGSCQVRAIATRNTGTRRFLVIARLLLCNGDSRPVTSLNASGSLPD